MMENLLPFDLDTALRKNDSVVTRSGLPARIICTDNEGSYPIVALIKRDAENGPKAFTFTKEGKMVKDGTDCELDLFIKCDDRNEQLMKDIENCFTDMFSCARELYNDGKESIAAKAKEWTSKIMNSTLPEGSIIITPDQMKVFENSLILKCDEMLDRLVQKCDCYSIAIECAKDIIKKLKEITEKRTKTDAGWPR